MHLVALQRTLGITSRRISRSTWAARFGHRGIVEGCRIDFVKNKKDRQGMCVVVVLCGGGVDERAPALNR